MCLSGVLSFFLLHPFHGVSPPLSAKALVDGAGGLDLLDVVAWLLAKTADQGLVASRLLAHG